MRFCIDCNEPLAPTCSSDTLRCRPCGNKYRNAKGAKRKHEKLMERKALRPPCPVCGDSLPLELDRAVYCSFKCQRTAANERWTGDRAFLYNIQYNYKLSPERYQSMLEAQNYRCANLVCLTDEPGGKGRWHIDHDHSCCPGKRSCGKCVRGLLCHSCSVGSGCFGDDPARLRAQADYIERFKP
jgi:hypothetical protein